MKTIARMYSGREGCMCGCRGKYYTPEDKGFKRVLNKFLKQTNIIEESAWAEATVGERVYVAYFAEEV